MNRFVVVGAGSIARRHIRNLKIKFPQSEIVCVSASGRMLSPAETGADVIAADVLSAINKGADAAIVASPAPWHISNALDFLRADIPVLIEKPIAHTFESMAPSMPELLDFSDKIEVGYNLRYTAAARKMKEILEQGNCGRLLFALVDVGQYLPEWRRNEDYRKNVSARSVLGGGVLLELSHELDYIRWFLGPISSVFCDAGSSGTLDIDVEDRVDAVLRTIDGCVVNLHMDFLQRVPSRVCKIVAEKGTLMWDIYRNSVHWLNASGGMDVLYEDANYDRNTAYLNELDQLCKIARNECKPFISVSDGIEVVALVEKLRISSNTGTVVKL